MGARGGETSRVRGCFGDLLRRKPAWSVLLATASASDGTAARASLRVCGTCGSGRPDRGGAHRAHRFDASGDRDAQPIKAEILAVAPTPVRRVHHTPELSRVQRDAQHGLVDEHDDRAGRTRRCPSIADHGLFETGAARSFTRFKLADVQSASPRRTRRERSIGLTGCIAPCKVGDARPRFRRVSHQGEWR